jgi:hypothetical protein
MKSIHRLISVLLLVGVGIEFFLAGAGAFGATSFHSHKILGMVLLAGGVLTFLAAVGARRSIRLGAIVAVLVGLQVLLGHLGETHPWVGAVHGLVAGVVAAVVGLNARKAVRGGGADRFRREVVGIAADTGR